MRVKSILAGISGGAFLLFGCGPDNDARDVCQCYQEVMRLENDEADQKMVECLELLEEYRQKHEENGTLEEFEKEHNICR